MASLIPKVIKWCVSAFFLIWGVGFLVMVKQLDHIGPLILAMFSFGIVYWQYKSRNEIPREVAIASLAVVALAGAASWFLFIDAFPFNQSFFAAWSAWTLLIGIPVIGWTYWKYG